MSSYPGTWPSRLGKAPTLKELSFIAWGLLFVAFVLPFFIVVATRHRPPDADFAGFYTLGRILNEHSPRDLYNYELQKRICEEVHPREGGYGPLPHPPFVGLFFRSFALLPYWVAYTLWALVSLLLYGVGLRIVTARFFPQPSLARSLLFALAYSYFPFIAYTAANGQLSAVGFFAIALALREDDLDHPVRAGLSLCLCLYKPTLLILILPVLLVSRRFRALAGFAAGTVILVLITSAFEGFGIWPDFLRAIRSFGDSSIGITKHSFLPLSKYVDLSSFSSNLHGGRSWPALAVFLGASLLAVLILLRFAWKSRKCGVPCNTLLWAATLTWTLLVNVYVPIYDSILVVLSILLSASVIRAAGTAMRRAFTALWLLILICSWFSVPLSRSTSVQVLTLLFAALGIVQFVALSKFERQSASGSVQREVQNG